MKSADDAVRWQTSIGSREPAPDTSSATRSVRRDAARSATVHDASAPAIQLLFLSSFSVVSVLGAGTRGHAVRRSEREIRDKLQTWRLRQLFPIATE